MAKGRIAHIGNKFYDIGTGNKSFLQLAKDLKKFGEINIELLKPYL